MDIKKIYNMLNYKVYFHTLFQKALPTQTTTFLSAATTAVSNRHTSTSAGDNAVNASIRVHSEYARSRVPLTAPTRPALGNWPRPKQNNTLSSLAAERPRGMLTPERRKDGVHPLPTDELPLFRP